MEAYLDFEKPIHNLERRLQDLRELSTQEGVDFSQEITLLEKKVSQLVEETFARLSPWQKVQLSRHPNRPYTCDYVRALFPDFMELHGDRAFGDDQAVLGGVATWSPGPGTAPIPVLIIGQQKGRSTKQKMERNFGMARPEGYRKAMRLMRLAERSRLPIITFIDTPGAYPGIDAEERGQSAAIAESIELMFSLTVPIISIVIGEGGSGGALAIGIGDRVLMAEYSVYSVISPESCASILWSDSTLAERASEKLKMSPSELLRMEVIDGIVPEPKGGAHRDWPTMFANLRVALETHFAPLVKDWLLDPGRVPLPSPGELKDAPTAEIAPARKKTSSSSRKIPKTKKPAASRALKKPSGFSLAPGLALRQARLARFRKLGNFALAEAPIQPGNGEEVAHS